MAMGWDDALILGAISAGTTAYAAHQSNSSNANINAFNSAQASEFFGQSQRFNAEEARLAREFNSNEASIADARTRWLQGNAQDFGKEMASTQYQRAVADMQAAGLNPMLAYSKGGNAAPSGTGASGPQASGPSASSGGGQVPSMIPMRSVGGEAAQSALQIVQAQKESKLMDAQIRLTENQAFAAGATGTNSMQDTRKKEAEVQNLIENQELIKAQVKQTTAQTGKTYIETAVQNAYHDLIQEDIKYRAGQTSFQNVLKEKAKLENILLENQQAKSEVESNYYKSEPGKMRPYQQQGLEVLDGITGAFKRGGR